MTNFRPRSDDIVAYSFQADIYCPDCIMYVLPTGPGEAFDGWEDISRTMTTEENLTELALAFGINRKDESSFDSNEFPKVIFDHQAGEDDYCGNCLDRIVG